MLALLWSFSLTMYAFVLYWSAEHVFVALRVHEYEMADVHFADAGDFDGALRAVFVVYREGVADRDVEHFGEPFGDYRAIVDQYLWLVCFAVA